LDLEQLRSQIKDLVSVQRDSQKQVHTRIDTLESKNHELESQISQVRNEQRKILGSYVDLENRYKEIINENRVIKTELADLRKNHKESSKVIIADQLNMPLRRNMDENNHNRGSIP
jgi:chromosome segregation ATPase